MSEQLKQAQLTAEATLMAEMAELMGAKKNPWEKKNVTIERQGSKIVLPSDPTEMTYQEGIETLKRMDEQANVEVRIAEEFNAFPLEGAWALTQVLKSRFGYLMSVQEREGFFGPQGGTKFLTLEVGFQQTEQVIWGELKIPGVDGVLEAQAMRARDGNWAFSLQGKVKQRSQETVKQIAEVTREFLRQNSIYSHQAIKLETHRNPKTGQWEVDLTNPPRFLDLEKIDEDQIVFSDDVAQAVNTNIFTLIERTEECRKENIPLKRAVLLEGKYGTGKTLVASAAAPKCVRNGWTYIYLDRVQGLKETLLFARRYSPCLIFCEDIERGIGGERTTEVDDILNNIDGIDSKNQEVICIFTTNHVEKINKAMLRAGRLDAIITVSPPDQKACERLIRQYAGPMLSSQEDISSASKELQGQIPAFIREAVERSKLFAISNTKRGEALKLTGNDIRLSAIGMKNHLALATATTEKKLSTGERLEFAFAEIMGRVSDSGYNVTYDGTGHIASSDEHTVLAEMKQAQEMN